MTKELSGYPSIDKPWLKYYSMATLRWELMEGYLKITNEKSVIYGRDNL